MKKVKLTIGIATLAIFVVMSCNKQAKVTPANAASGGMAITTNSSNNDGSGKNDHLGNKDYDKPGDESVVQTKTHTWIWCTQSTTSVCKDKPNRPFLANTAFNNIVNTIKEGDVESIRDTFVNEADYLEDTTLNIRSEDVEAVINGDLNVSIDSGIPIANVDEHLFFSFYSGDEFNVDSVQAGYGYAVDTVQH